MDYPRNEIKPMVSQFVEISCTRTFTYYDMSIACLPHEAISIPILISRSTVYNFLSYKTESAVPERVQKGVQNQWTQNNCGDAPSVDCTLLLNFDIFLLC